MLTYHIWNDNEDASLPLVTLEHVEGHWYYCLASDHGLWSYEDDTTNERWRLQPGPSSAGNLMMACHFQGAVYEDYTDLYPMDPGFTAGFTAYMDSARTPTAGYRCLIMPGSSHDHLPWRTCRLTTGEWWFYLGFGVACGLSQNLYSWRSQIDISMRQFFYTKETKVSFCGGTCVLRNDNQEGLNDWHSSCCLQWKFLSENKCIRKMAARSNPKQRPRVTENNRECHCYTIFS